MQEKEIAVFLSKRYYKCWWQGLLDSTCVLYCTRHFWNNLIWVWFVPCMGSRIIIYLSDIKDPKDLRLVHWNHKQSNLAIIWAWMLCVSYKLFCLYVTPFPDHRSIHTFCFANIWTIRILFVFLLYSNESKSGKTEKKISSINKQFDKLEVDCIAAIQGTEHTSNENNRVHTCNHKPNL